MLTPIKHVLTTKRIVLASGSPRRQELIQSIGLNVELCPSTYEENLDPNAYKNDFSKFVEETAAGKAREVYERLNEENSDKDLLVIAADTMVTLGKEIYGKPKNSQDAVRMLTNLSGRCNVVYTGVVLKHSKGILSFTEKTNVYFGELTPQQVQAYVDTGDPLDKAGAYGIQGIGGTLISKIDGDFYCVMGLPLHRLCSELCRLFKEVEEC